MEHDWTLRLNVDANRWYEPLVVQDASGAWVSAKCPVQILGSVFPVAVRFYVIHNGVGTLVGIDPSHTLKLFCTNRDGVPLFGVLDFSGSAGVWTGTLSLNTAALVAAMRDYREATYVCDLRLVDSSGNLIRLWQFEMPVRRYAFSGTPVTFNPAAMYYTRSECDARFGLITGVVEIPVGQYHVEVTGLGLDAPPASVQLTTQTPDATDSPLLAWVAGAPTEDGFLIMTTAAAPKAGYKVHYVIKPGVEI